MAALQLNSTSIYPSGCVCGTHGTSRLRLSKLSTAFYGELGTVNGRSSVRKGNPDFDVPSPGTQRYTFRRGRPPGHRRAAAHWGSSFNDGTTQTVPTRPQPQLSWAQWQEEVPVVSNTVTVGPCGTGFLKWAGIEPTLAMLRTRLAAFDTARRPVGIPNDTPTESHQPSR